MAVVLCGRVCRCLDRYVAPERMYTVGRVGDQVEALKATLGRFSASLARHQLNVKGGVAIQKYSVQRRLNELQTSVMMNLHRAYDLA